MKKSLFAIAAVVALFATSCSKEFNNEVIPQNNVVTLRASVSNTDTKVSIDGSYAFAFQAGDKISVIDNEGSPIEFETTEGGTSVDFSGELTEGKALGSYALYPASSDHLVDANDVLFNLDASITWVADESRMPMLGKIENTSASFKSVGGVLKLIVYNIPESAKYLQFSATNKQITGGFEIADASIDSPVIVTAAKNGSNNTLIIDFSADYAANKVFYIPLPTGTIDGFTVAFLDENNAAIDGASKTTSASLNVTRNKLIIGPALNCAPATEVTLWSEDFSGYEANDVPEEGNGYNEATVSYSIANGGGTTKIFEEELAGGSSPELLVAKSQGSLTASGIPTAGCSTMTLSYKANNTLSISSSTEGVTIGTVSSAGTTYTAAISNASGVSSFALTFKATGSKNVRLDDIVLVGVIGTAPATPVIETLSGDSATINAGGEKASINGIKLTNPLDNLGITASTDADWLEVAFTDGTFETGAKLTATALSYNHGSEARIATVTLKATGATKTVTFKQNPSIVNKPTSLTLEAGNKTFTATWTADNKVESYIAYYSTSELANPSTGIVLSINGTSATPLEELVNGTTYYVYVKASILKEEYAGKYAIADEWAEGSVKPIGINGSIDDPYSAAEAIAVIETLTAGEPTDDFYYVGGTLNADPSYFGSGKLTFTFVDESNNVIKAYNCFGLDGASFSGKSDLKEGDQVVVFGNLEKYVNSSNVTEYEIVNGQLAKLTTATGGNTYGTITITRSSFPSGSLAYNETDIWTVTATTGETITGEGDLYSSANQTTMQSKNSGVSTMYHNTVATPGPITKITLSCASGTTRTYTAYLNTSSVITSTSGGTSKGTIAPAAGKSASLTLSASDNWHYFWLNLAGGASYLDSIVIEYLVTE